MSVIQSQFVVHASTFCALVPVSTPLTRTTAGSVSTS